MLNPFEPVGKHGEDDYQQKTITVSSQENAEEGTDEKQLTDEIQIFTGEELLNSPLESIPCLLEPLFPQCGLAALGGSSDTGKSAILRLFAISVALGFETFLGFKLFLRYQRAIYVSSEDAKDAMICLLKKQNRGLRHNSQAFKNISFIFDWGRDLIQTLERELKKQRVDVIVIDAFMDVFTGGVKDNDRIREFLRGYKRIAERYGCLILFLHHTGKGTENKAPSKNNFIGGQSFEAKVRVAIEFRIDSANPQLRHFCVVKGNYIPQEYKDRSYVLRFDENMIFHNTGERIPLHDVVPAVSENASQNKSHEKGEKNDGKNEQIAKLLQDNYTYSYIQEHLKVSPGRVRRVKQEQDKAATTATTSVEMHSNTKVAVVGSVPDSALDVAGLKDRPGDLARLEKLADKVLQGFQPRTKFNLLRAIAISAETNQDYAEVLLKSMVENSVINHCPADDTYWLD